MYMIHYIETTENGKLLKCNNRKCYSQLKVTYDYIFSERELKFMFAICHRPSVCRLSSVVCRLSVCRLSVTFVRPTQMIEIFGNVSTP